MEVTFRRPFALKGVGSAVPPGTYRVEAEEERVEGLSFPARRRVATFIRLPEAGHGAGSSQVLPVDPQELAKALARDAAVDEAATG